MVEVLEALAELREGWFQLLSGRCLLLGCGVVGGVNGYMHIDTADSPRPAGAANGEGIGKYDVCNFMAA